jgi:hypothetical protein
MPELADRLLITQDGIRIFLREIVWYNDADAHTVKCGVRYPMVDPQAAQLVRALDFWVTSGDAIFRTRKVLKEFAAGAYLAMEANDVDDSGTPLTPA